MDWDILEFVKDGGPWVLVVLVLYLHKDIKHLFSTQLGEKMDRVIDLLTSKFDAMSEKIDRLEKELDKVKKNGHH